MPSLVQSPEAAEEERTGINAGLGSRSGRPVEEVVMHPLVLLSVVDHFHRVRKTTRVGRVVGVLLGSLKPGKRLDVSNSFAVPFDEDASDPSVWFLDHDYLDSMYTMFRKVAAKEKIVGWYHTGPRLHPNDMAINEKMKEFCADPVLVIVEPEPRDLGLPTSAYLQVSEVAEDGKGSGKTMEHLPTSIGAEEAEEVGVEHLLRDLKDQTAGTLSQQITDQLTGLRGLHSQLQSILSYLLELQNGSLPVNQEILTVLQEALQHVPSARNLNAVANSETNDEMLCIFMGALSQCVATLHDLIQNKLSLRELEKSSSLTAKDKAKEKEKDKEKDKDTPTPSESKEDASAKDSAKDSSAKDPSAK